MVELPVGKRRSIRGAVMGRVPRFHLLSSMVAEKVPRQCISLHVLLDFDFVC